MPDSIAPAVARTRTVRATMLVATVFVAILTLSLSTVASASSAATAPAAPAQAAQLLAPSAGSTSTSPRTATAAAPKRAVIVVGPVAGQTAEYVGYGKQISAALTAMGVSVDLILPPHSTWANVTAVADGADFFAYIGHGNGWPSPYANNGEESHDGLGLDPTDGDTNYSHVAYYGANFLKGGYHCTLGVPTPATQAECGRIKYGVWKDYGAGIHLASDAIVLLNHLCYASGNGEPGMAIPTQAVAMQRADNHANGWLAVGARVVFSLSWQPGQDIVNWLGSQHTTMDGLFEMRDSTNGYASVMPSHGWVGYIPDLYLHSTRTPGATVHLDPDLDPAHRNGYLRAVTGDLTFTTDDWWSTTGSGGGGTDTTPPVISGFTAQQSANTIPADTAGPAIFTPNGDGLSDTVTFHHSLSEPASLAIAVTAADGSSVRQFTSYSAAGDSTDSWDGTDAAGTVVADGAYTVTVTPTDGAGNVGDPASTRVKVLTTMASQSVSPPLFYAADGDALAQTSTQSVTLTTDATLTWVVTDRSGNVVKTALSSQAVSAGLVSWDWDGTDDSGQVLPNGIYRTVVTASTDAGTYSQVLSVRLMPFKVSAKATTVRAGQLVKLSITAAEPQMGRPVVSVTQTGLATHKVATIQHSSTKFTVSFKVKAGGTAGAITITIVGTDVNGGVDTQTFIITRQ